MTAKSIRLAIIASHGNMRGMSRMLMVSEKQIQSSLAENKYLRTLYDVLRRERRNQYSRKHFVCHGTARISIQKNEILFLDDLLIRNKRDTLTKYYQAMPLRVDWRGIDRDEIMQWYEENFIEVMSA